MHHRHRPHAVDPHHEKVRVVLAYKNFGANKGVSHIGLGVAALNTMQTLRANGMHADVWPITSPDDLDRRLAAEQSASLARGEHPVSHVVVSAPWIPTERMRALIMQHPDVHFAVNSHSNVGFLMADPSGIRLLREGLELAVGHHNFSIGGNSAKFVDAWTRMYGVPCAWLPNLYNVEHCRAVGHRRPWSGGTLRVGVFGATRPLKNMVTAVAACIEAAGRLHTDVEVWMNSGRDEGGKGVQSAIEQLVVNLPAVKLRHAGWQSWPGFRQVVASMHLLMQPSYTESFNMVTADGIAMGVTSVVSDAIDWAPQDWMARVDDVSDVARIGTRLLHDVHAVDEGQRALRTYVASGLDAWRRHLRA